MSLHDMSEASNEVLVEDNENALIKIFPYVLGNSYLTLEGRWVRFVAVHNEGTHYESMEDEDGVNRYTRRDFGRVAGSSHTEPDPRNTPPLYSLENYTGNDMKLGGSNFIKIIAR